MSNRYLDDRGRKGLTSNQRDNKHDRSRSRSRSSRSQSSSYSSSSSRSRSRSRSKHRRNSKSRSHSRSVSPERSKHSSKHDSHRSDYRKGHGSSSSSSSMYPNRRHVDEASDKDREQDLEQLAPPPPPIISKISMQFGTASKTAKPVQLKLAASKPTETVKKLAVASAFSNNDSDDEVEEMPAECRMRMRNIGRDTPTSSGPNSFGKTKQGFCDAKKIFEKNLKNMTYD